MENLIFHLIKGYSVNYWGACSLCAPSAVPTALYYSTQSHGWFFRKKFTENEVLLVVLSVILGKHKLPNFDVHLMLTNLTLVSNENRIRDRFLSHLILLYCNLKRKIRFSVMLGCNFRMVLLKMGEWWFCLIICTCQVKLEPSSSSCICIKYFFKSF